MLHFRKMHGLGNDFVVLDGRKRTISLTMQQIQGDRRPPAGVGSDAVGHPAPRAAAHRSRCFYGSYNQDGSQAGACGNVSRCASAKLLFAEDPTKTQVVIQNFVAGLLECKPGGGWVCFASISVTARRDWRDIPLAESARYHGG
jgi:diaminopimelate epimerase